MPRHSIAPVFQTISLRHGPEDQLMNNVIFNGDTMNILNYTEAHNKFRRDLAEFLEKELVPDREQWEDEAAV